MRDLTIFVMASAGEGATLGLAIATGVLAVATVALAVISVRGIGNAREDVTRQIDAREQRPTNSSLRRVKSSTRHIGRC